MKQQLRQLSTEPYGMLLVTGPTGSGKTTTLYAAISEVNKGQDKIITIEDPVEYQLPGVLQIPVNEQKGLSFARGLRSILRHDPDRIMVGEIRDPETAEIAVQSALTGHLVYTTVHANNAIDVLGRFQHMGVDSYNLVSALNGVLAQRLVRMFCTAMSRQRLRRLPRHRLQGPQGDRRAAGAERRAARADRRARAGAQAEGSGACRRHACRCATPRCSWCTPAKPHSRRSIVSLLWRNHIRISLCAESSCSPPTSAACARKGKASVTPVQGNPNDPEWRAALDALPAALAGFHGHDVSVVLADQFVRYALLPWNAALKSAEQWLALARHRLRRACTARRPPTGR